MTDPDGERRPATWVEWTEDVVRSAALPPDLGRRVRHFLEQLTPSAALTESLSAAYATRRPADARAALRKALAALVDARPHARSVVNGVALVACELLCIEVSEQEQTFAGIEQHGALVDRILWSADRAVLAEPNSVDETRDLLTLLVDTPSIAPEVSAFALDLLDGVAHPVIRRDLRELWSVVERSADHTLDVDADGLLLIGGVLLTFLETREGVAHEQPVTAKSNQGQVILRAAAGRDPWRHNASAVSRARSALKRRQYTLDEEHRIDPRLRCTAAALHAIVIG